jgi:hypothetical protein
MHPLLLLVVSFQVGYYLGWVEAYLGHGDEVTYLGHGDGLTYLGHGDGLMMSNVASHETHNFGCGSGVITYGGRQVLNT